MLFAVIFTLIFNNFFALEIYITDRTQPIGNGSYSLPYNNFITALAKTSQIYKNKTNASEIELNFLFVTEFILIVDSDLTSTAANLTKISNISQLHPLLSLFKMVRIMPFFCYQDLLANISIESCPFKTFIALKTFNFTFLINTNFHLQNLIFTGNDLNMVFDNSTDYYCFYNYNGCCSFPNSGDSKCMNKTANTAVLIGLLGNYKYSLFYVTNEVNNTSLQVTNCEFTNINGIGTNSGYSTLFSTSNNSLQNYTVLVHSSLFSYNYFKDGMFEFLYKSIGFVMNNVTISYYNYYNISDNLKKQAFQIANAAFFNITNCVFTNNLAILKIISTNLFIGNTFFFGKSPIINISLIATTAILVDSDALSNITLFNISISEFVLPYTGPRSFFLVLNYLTLNSCKFFDNILENHRFFSVISSNILIINDLNFTNNTAVSSAGGMFMLATLVPKTFSPIIISNSFFNLIITTGLGGLFSLTSNLALINTTISNMNSILTNSSTTSQGAIIYASASNKNFQFVNVKIHDVFAQTALFHSPYLGNSYLLLDCSLYSISILEYGIFVGILEINIYIENSFFHEILAGRTALLYSKAFSKSFILNNSYFSNITTTQFQALGGMIEITNAYNCMISNTKFEKIVSSGDSGIFGIWNGIANLTNVEVLSVQTYFSGGAFIFYNATVYLQNVSINDSTAITSAGGAIKFEYSSGTIDNLLISNAKTICDWQPGGGIFIEQNNYLIFTNSYFANNYNLLDQGGFAFISRYNIITFDNCVFFNNTAYNISKGKGGLISLDHDNILTLTNCFADNFFSLSGGIYANNFSNITIENCTFRNGVSKKEGAVFYLNLYINLNITNSIFMDSSSDLDGGFLFAGQKSSIILINSSFYNNSCAINGGVISLNLNNHLNITNCSFSYNYAGVFAGSLHSLENNILFIDTCVFFHNKAEQEGGNFDFEEGNSMQILNCIIEFSFSSNAAVIRMTQYNSIEFTNISISNSFALSNGGVFLLYLFNSLVFSNCTIYKSFADVSGALGNAETSNTIKFMNISLILCQSNSSGGVLYLGDLNNVNFKSTNFLESYSLKQSGGFAYINGGNLLKLVDCSFVKSSAFHSGGWIYLFYFNELQISNVNVTDSMAISENGGYIFAHHNNFVAIQNSTLLNCSSSSSGGTFYLLAENTLEITNFTLNNSRNLRDFGGFLYAEMGNLVNLRNSSIYDVKSGNTKAVFMYIVHLNVINFTNCKITTFWSKIVYDSYFISTQENNLTLLKISLIINYTNVVFQISSTNLRITYLNFNENIACATLIVLEYSKVEIKYVNLKFIMKSGLFSAMNSTILLSNFQIAPTIIQLQKKIDNSTFFIINAMNSNLFFQKGIVKKFFEQTVANFLFSSFSQIKLVKVLFSGIVHQSFSSLFSLFDLEFLKVHKCVFIGSNNVYSGGVFSLNSSINTRVSLNQNVFSSNKAKFEGGVLYLNQLSTEKISVSIVMNVFSNNFAFQGGAISVHNIDNFLIDRSNFLRNRAQNKVLSSKNRSKGGVLNCEFSKNITRFEIISSCFSNNSAEIGGILYQNGYLSIRTQNITTINNRALYYGNEFSSEVYEITFLSDLNEWAFRKNSAKLNNVASGKKFEKCSLYIVGIDKFGNFAYMNEDLSPEKLEIHENYNNYSNTENSTLSNSFVFSSNYGAIYLNGPFARKSLPIAQSFVYEFSYSNLHNKSSLTLSLNFRSCLFGERLNDNYTCINCDIGEYSFQTNFDEISPACSSCSDRMPFYCFGGAQLTPKPNYWRLSNSSTHFLQCNKDACEGDFRYFSDISQFVYEPIYATGSCQRGHKGILCDECEDGYGKVNQNTCAKCGTENYGLSLITQLIIRVTFSLFSILSAMNMNKMISKRQNEKSSGVISSNILKVFINHIQVLTMILYLPFKWPENLSYSLSIVFSLSPSISESLSLECVLDAFESKLNLLYFKVICTVLYPFILLFLCLIFLALQNFIQKNKKTMKNTFTIAFYWYPFSLLMTIFLLCYNDIVQVLMQLLEHQNFGDSANPEFRVVKDKTILYDAEDHQFVLKCFGIPLIVLVGILLPLAIFFYLLHKRIKNKLNEELVLFNFGFYFFTFKENFFFWDLLTLIRKSLIYFVQIYFFSFTEYSSLYPLNLMISIVLLSLILQINFKPFQPKDFQMINTFETNSLFTLFLSYYFAIIYLFKIISSEEINFYYIGFCGLIPAIVNLIFAWNFIHLYYKHNIRSKVQKGIDLASSGIRKIQSLVKSATKKSIDSPRSKKSYENSPFSPAKRTSEFGLIKKSLNFKDACEEANMKKKPIKESPFDKVNLILRPSFSLSKSIDLDDIKMKTQRTPPKKTKRNKKLMKFLNIHYLNNYQEITNYQEIIENSIEIAAKLETFDYYDLTSVSTYYKNMKNGHETLEKKLNFAKEKAMHDFMEENFNYFLSSFAKNGIYIKSDGFSIENDISFLGLHPECVFIRLQMKFITNNEIIDFSYENSSKQSTSYFLKNLKIFRFYLFFIFKNFPILLLSLFD